MLGLDLVVWVCHQQNVRSKLAVFTGVPKMILTVSLLDQFFPIISIHWTLLCSSESKEPEWNKNACNNSVFSQNSIFSMLLLF